MLEFSTPSTEKVFLFYDFCLIGLKHAICKCLLELRARNVMADGNMCIDHIEIDFICFVLPQFSLNVMSSETEFSAKVVALEHLY